MKLSNMSQTAIKYMYKI